MNLEIFKIPDPSGKLFKEKFLSKNHIAEYDYIIEYSAKYNFSNLPFKERVYLCINNIKILPMCKNIDCNKIVNYKNSTIGYYDYCCNKCISSDVNIKKIKEVKSYEKFGTKSPSQSKIIKDKITNTNIIKYGGKSPMCNVNIQNKSKETLFKNYNILNPSHDPILLSKRIESFKKSDYKITFENTCIKKYGVKHPWSDKKIHKKTIEFFYKSYKNKILNKIKNTKYIFYDFEYDPTNLIFTCPDCKSNFIITPYQFYYRVTYISNNLCTNCFPISENSSLMQIDLYNYIKENYNGEILVNQKILNPYEIDIFLPDINLGIEFNGLYWHSNIHKSDDYHLKKYNKSIENNIRLITIWEDDWIFRKDICKSFLLNKLQKTKRKIYARKCIIKDVYDNENVLFLQNNHLDGNFASEIRYGLYYEGELVFMMTFNKLDDNIR